MVGVESVEDFQEDTSQSEAPVDGSWASNRSEVLVVHRKPMVWAALTRMTAVKISNGLAVSRRHPIVEVVLTIVLAGGDD